MDVSVIVPCSVDHVGYLDELFKSLSDQEFTGSFEVLLIIDDEKSKGEVEKLRKYPIELRVFFSNAKNPGVNRNIGIREAKASRIAFIDSDCVPERTWLATLMKTLDSCDGVQGIDYSYDNSFLGKFLEEQQLNFLYTSVEGGRCRFIDTRNFAVKAEVLKKVGFFDESLETSEDKDLGFRLYQAGYNITLNKEMIVRHRWKKGSFLSFFRWGVWYGRGDYIFSRKWNKTSKKTEVKSALKDIRSSFFYFVKALRSPREKRDVYVLFSSRQLGVAYGKLRALFSKT